MKSQRRRLCVVIATLLLLVSCNGADRSVDEVATATPSSGLPLASETTISAEFTSELASPISIVADTTKLSPGDNFSIRIKNDSEFDIQYGLALTLQDQRGSAWRDNYTIASSTDGLNRAPYWWRTDASPVPVEAAAMVAEAGTVGQAAKLILPPVTQGEYRLEQTVCRADRPRACQSVYLKFAVAN